MPGKSPPPARERLAHLDALRGLVMVLMVLDHARDFFGDLRLDPEDVDSASPQLFATRWVTHLCAPTFVFLAGVSVELSGRPARAQLARGLKLAALEFTLISLAWTLQPSLRLVIQQVIAAIGAGLIAVAALRFAGRRATALVALVVLVGHDALAGVQAARLGAWGPLWTILLEPGQVALPAGWRLQVIYPLAPWAALLALGWA